jgi:hypothetical protein
MAHGRCGADAMPLLSLALPAKALDTTRLEKYF